ncbi:hypothetical protein K491DRAFT_720434 [Lophiostoma macrostomum CBS 122681]|uniref:Uncharacterized protein n=1 Tax=Lophiostoma macrostomum CBS 122681 TaxID=1314788 RepID=A0A6A6SSM5_9PLEO|nr:hypothetical protein K491DRAFT_720434 [Lophiostoma macrostomum CBS 122681]
MYHYNLLATALLPLVNALPRIVIDDDGDNIEYICPYDYNALPHHWKAFVMIGITAVIFLTFALCAILFKLCSKKQKKNREKRAMVQTEGDASTGVTAGFHEVDMRTYGSDFGAHNDEAGFEQRVGHEVGQQTFEPSLDERNHGVNFEEDDRNTVGSGQKRTVGHYN